MCVHVDRVLAMLQLLVNLGCELSSCLSKVDKVSQLSLSVYLEAVFCMFVCVCVCVCSVTVALSRCVCQNASLW